MWHNTIQYEARPGGENPGRKDNTMKKTMTRNGKLTIVKTEVVANNHGTRIFLTTKTCEDGAKRYAVVLRNRRTHRHTLVKACDRIIDAYAVYKTVAAI